jgi:hypothetical protein
MPFGNRIWRELKTESHLNAILSEAQDMVNGALQSEGAAISSK